MVGNLLRFLPHFSGSGICDRAKPSLTKSIMSSIRAGLALSSGDVNTVGYENIGVDIVDNNVRVVSGWRIPRFSLKVHIVFGYRH